MVQSVLFRFHNICQRAILFKENTGICLCEEKVSHKCFTHTQLINNFIF